jgi:hypothetical protein
MNIPLINNFTKNLSGCSGCGKSDEVYETWSKAKQLGVKMKFQFAVVIDAETYKEAVSKVPDEFEILQGGVKPEPRPQSTQATGSRIQGSQLPSHMSISPTPTTTVTQPA